MRFDADIRKGLGTKLKLSDEDTRNDGGDDVARETCLSAPLWVIAQARIKSVEYTDLIF